MRFKKGVTLNVREEITCTFPVIDEVWTDNCQVAVVTCGDNGKHTKYSDHYKKLAVDLRTRYFTYKIKLKVARELRKRLGKDYYVLVHKTHIHLAYKPTR